MHAKHPSSAPQVSCYSLTVTPLTNYQNDAEGLERLGRAPASSWARTDDIDVELAGPDRLSRGQWKDGERTGMVAEEQNDI